MDEATSKAGIALHIVMALCADMAIHDEERLQRVADILAGMVDQQKAWSAADRAEVRAAYDAVAQLRGTHPPTE